MGRNRPEIAVDNDASDGNSTQTHRRNPSSMSRGFVVTMLVIVLVAAAVAAVLVVTKHDQTETSESATKTSLATPYTTSTAPPAGGASVQQVVAQGCRYGNEALAQVMQAQASPATLYANTPDVGYLVEIEEITEASLTPSSAINTIASNASSVRETWDAMEPLGSPPVSTLIAQIQTVIADCQAMGLSTSLN